jgi:hypothetical protein
MAELSGRVADPAQIRHVRDAALLAWRYRNPIREYRFFYYERRGALEGYLALGRYPSYRPPMHPFHIADLEASSPQVRAELLESALAWGRFPDLLAWTGTERAENRALLARHGFIPTDLRLRARGLPCVLLRRLGAPSDSEWTLGTTRALDAGHWDIRLIDSMHG